MNSTTRRLLVTLFATLAIGCRGNEAPPTSAGAGDPPVPQSQPPKPEGDVMEYTSAEVNIGYGPLADRTKRIEEQAQIQQLLSFFPAAGSGLTGPEPPAPWVNAVVINFTRADGTVLKVTTNCDFWSEGRREEYLFTGFYAAAAGRLGIGGGVVARRGDQARAARR
jgi:hypothetical protein